MTVDRQMQALQLLGVLTCEETEITEGKSRWYYSVAAHIDVDAIRCPDLSLHGNRESEVVCLSTDISGQPAVTK